MKQSGPPRFLTAASLFDGHDVSINLMRRLLQAKGVEVIHLGHNRSAQEVVDAALSEDVHAIALSSYQGGHVEYFSFIRQLLEEADASQIRIFGGGGGTITAAEKKHLESLGITRIYTPFDGAELGLEGIIDDMIKKALWDLTETSDRKQFFLSDQKAIPKRKVSQALTWIETYDEPPFDTNDLKSPSQKSSPQVLGITGTGGAGKSSLIDELILRLQNFSPHKKLALLSIDPSKKKGKGALLGDRIRLGNIFHDSIYARSLATRGSGTEIAGCLAKSLNFLKAIGFDLILVETAGIGQAFSAITEFVDHSVYVMTPEFGAQSQLEKIDMLDLADVVVLNKFERPRAEDALRDIRKQYRRNHQLFDRSVLDQQLPVFATIASRFNDKGVDGLFWHLMKLAGFSVPAERQMAKESDQSIAPIAPARLNYLHDIATKGRADRLLCESVSQKLKSLEALEESQALLNTDFSGEINRLKSEIEGLDPFIWKDFERFDELEQQYKEGKYEYKVRGSKIALETQFTSLSGLKISKVAIPRFFSRAQKYLFLKKENLPGYYPFTAGVFPFKRRDEEPKRMFAGEGGPKRTNERFHFLSEGEKFKRLSTAFDSVTLYGEDPDERLDIFGKIGESGVSIATLADMEDLFSGIDLSASTTSVSMTINGPAPIILAMFMNAAIKQKLPASELDDFSKRLEIMQKVRGTVQADILKEDQAQNTCIFSLEFALKMMGDVQEFFCRHKIRDYYTVSISGYHIAEAGANPISQLAFTLSNGLTYIEYYLSRGLDLEDFSHNLSFFFSNGLDPEYSVLGRVARRIWAQAMKQRYGASEKAQKLKYHIQTSGRSLHAQEIDFNDIRTTLQAFLALSDNCNSLHTNAYDEAITTPTTESVRRAMAIQLIVNREFGLSKSDNPLQGSYLIEELSDLVEEAVWKEFEKISSRGGVLGAMETVYQRSQIQEESMLYEDKKNSGELPIIGVNTFLAPSQNLENLELTRASQSEKHQQIKRLRDFQEKHRNQSHQALEQLKNVAIGNGNIFEELLSTVQHCSLGQITQALYQVGGRFRRNL